MTTHITEPAVAADPAAGWRTTQQLATNATWQVSGAVPVAPFCISQLDRGGRHSTYAGDLHYSDTAPVLAIAAEYDVPVNRKPSAGTDTCVSVSVVIDGIEVRAWAMDRGTDAPAGGESA